MTPVAATGTTQGTAVESAREGAIVPAQAAPTVTVQAITGTQEVGETLTGHYTYSDVNEDLEGISTFKWYRSDNATGLNKSQIAGATSLTYVLQSSDIGKYISFEVTPVATTGTLQGTAVESARTGAVVLAEAAPTATLQAITGTLQVGETLTGNYTYSDVNGDIQGTSTFKWYRSDNASGLNKTEIAGATASTYVLQSADVGKYISFEVTPVAITGTLLGTAVESARAGVIVPAEAAPTATLQAITGTLQVGETLTGHYTYSDVNGDIQGTSTFKWYRSDNASGLNKTAIAGATASTYDLQSADTGKYISFEVTPVAITGMLQGAPVESARTGAIVPAEEAPTATVQAITGTLEVGETLTGHYTYSDVNGDLEGTSTFKWYRSDNATGLNKSQIAVATSMTYVLNSADIGKYISFEVTPVATTGTQQGTAVESTRTGAVVLAEASPTAAVQAITGNLQVGETLAGHYTYSDVNGDLEGTSTYKWYRSDNVAGLNKTVIAGAATTSYVLQSADIGKYISFEVTPIAATGTLQGTAVESARVGAIAIAQVAPTATLQAITGTLQVGETLTGHYTYSDVNGDVEGTSTFKWYRSDNLVGLNKTEIAGATSLTYVLQSADLSKYISFEVTPVAVTGPLQGVAFESERRGTVANKPSGSSTPSSNTSATPVAQPVIKASNTEVLVNDNKVTYATTEVKQENGKQTTTVKLDDEKITNQIKQEKVGSTITIPISSKADVAIGQLNGQTVKNMEGKQAVLEIVTENIKYTIPAGDINIENVVKKLENQIELKDSEVALKDIQVNVNVSKASNETKAKAEDWAKKNNCELVVEPVEFEISCTYQNSTVEVSRFNSYIERAVAIPEGIDPNKITTGVVLNKDGSFSHVPTMVEVIDGKYYAKINSLTNSTYTVIWNPVTFKDVDNHWSKESANEVGSRLIDNGVGGGNFAPNRAITRAEFASMVVNALGLRGTNVAESFSDVDKHNVYHDEIYAAYEYGILSGYSNGKFGPNDLITREQAMKMLAKAMEIAGVNANVSDTDISSQLKLFSDSDSLSSYARKTAAICVKAGIFGGDNKGRLTPKASFTRAESATVIIKLLKQSELI